MFAIAMNVIASLMNQFDPYFTLHLPKFSSSFCCGPGSIKFLSGLQVMSDVMAFAWYFGYKE
jgi:hypothetical protein